MDANNMITNLNKRTKSMTCYAGGIKTQFVGLNKEGKLRVCAEMRAMAFEDLGYEMIFDRSPQGSDTLVALFKKEDYLNTQNIFITRRNDPRLISSYHIHGDMNGSSMGLGIYEYACFMRFVDAAVTEAEIRSGI